MPSELKRANESIEPYVDRLIDEFNVHASLREHEVRIDFLIAYPEVNADGFAKGPAILHRGMKALGLCRVVNYRDRIKGLGDAEITLDGEYWDEATERERLALLDHELTHIELNSLGGDIERDDAGRPKVRMKKHDFEVGWFHGVAARWKSSASEVRQARVLQEGHLKQVYFEFMDESGDLEPTRDAVPIPKARRPRAGRSARTPTTPQNVLDGTFG